MKRISLTQLKKYVSFYQRGMSVNEICRQYKVPRSSLYIWINKYKETITAGSRVNVAEFQKLTAHAEKQAQMITILQTVDCNVSSPVPQKLSELEKLKNQYSTRVLCESLKVNRNTFNNYLATHNITQQKRQQHRDEMKKVIQEVYDESLQIYGAYKIRAVLNERGYKIGPDLVLELMSEMGIKSIRGSAKKDYIRLTSQRKVDMVKMNFTTSRPNEIWVSDVSCFKVKDLYQYVCVILDLYSRKVIAYRISTVHSTQLITKTFKNAYETRKPILSLIFHSDRGTQYTANSFRMLLRKLGVSQSFSNPHNPYNNSVAESFFATLKKEEIYRNDYRSDKDFRNHIKLFIEFYNTKRKHSVIQYKTPDKYEEIYNLNNNEDLDMYGQ